MKIPARETRYQDIRLYGRALTPEEAKRLPFEDYVAEDCSKPAASGLRTKWHVVSEFYFNNIDKSQRKPRAR
jgi:hypothetical protein